MKCINKDVWWMVRLLSIAFVAMPAHAATYLGRSSQTRTPSVGRDSYTSYSSSDDSNESAKTDVEDENEDHGYFVFPPPKDLPDDWLPARFRTSAEIGLQHWVPFSSSSGHYEASYDIDPVTTTIFETTVRVKNWLCLLDYTTSLTDPDRVRNLLAQVSRIHPGAGAWWSLYVERGAVEGEASAEDQFGNRVEYPVDTVWHRMGIEWRTYEGFAAGLVFEDLTMPTILTFNNEQVAFAVFDENAQARTLSFSLGYDRSRRLLNSFKEGGAWAWSLDGSIGAGWLSYSKDEARRIIEAQGYEFDSNQFLVTGALDGRLGYTYSKSIWGSDVQCFAGVRLRASGWLNIANDEPEADTAELDARFGLVTPGVFTRVSLQW